MAKRFTFQFYVDDWAGGTNYLTHEERGAFLELLIQQYRDSGLTEVKIRRILGPDHARLWESLKDKFKKSPDGLFFNEKMASVIKSQQEYSKSRSENSSKPKPRKPKSHDNHVKITDESHENHAVDVVVVVEEDLGGSGALAHVPTTRIVPTSDITYPDDDQCTTWVNSEREVGGKVVRLPNPASMTFPGDDGSLGWAVALRRVWDKVTPQSGNGLKILHGIQCFSDIDPPSFWDNAIWYLTYKIVTDSIPHNLENWIKDEHFRKDWKEVFHTDSKVKKKAAPIFEQLRFEQEMNEAISKFKR